MKTTASLAFAIVVTAANPADATAPEMPVVIAQDRFIETVPAPTIAFDVAADDRQVTSGTASWYEDKLRAKGGFYAAVPSYRWGDPPYDLEVCTVEDCVTVTVGDYCQCYVGTADERVIDLSPAAFSRLAPLHHGLVIVTVEEVP